VSINKDHTISSVTTDSAVWGQAYRGPKTVALILSREQF